MSNAPKNDKVNTLAEIDLLEAVLAATEQKAVPPPFVLPEQALVAASVKPTPEVWPDQYLAALFAAPKPTTVVAKPPVATQQQKDLIARLREKAKEMGGLAANVSASKCDNTAEAATAYITELQDLIEEQSNYKPEPPKPSYRTGSVRRPLARSGRPVSPKQWAFIKHLRGRMRDLNTAASRDLARREIANDRRLASLYIQQMIDTAKQAFTATRPRTGSMICSVCWKPGCGVGPMVPWNGEN